jgi:hypothetical protein
LHEEFGDIDLFLSSLYSSVICEKYSEMELNMDEEEMSEENIKKKKEET